MKELNNNTTGLAVGGVVAVWHLVWSLLVALGLAQAWVDWALDLHFLNNPYIVGSFDPTKAVVLIVVTFVVGYLFGWVFAYLWNWLWKK